MMSKMGRPLALLVLLSSLYACGDDPAPSVEPVTPPETPERELPASGGPFGEIDEPDFGEEEPESADGLAEEVAEPDLSSCCEVTFALADPYEDAEETSVTLRGDIPGISEEDGLELAYANGVWEATACVSIEYAATYYYEVALPTDDPDTDFYEEWLNPVVPTTRTDDGVRNSFSPADSCEAEALLIHSRAWE